MERERDGSMVNALRGRCCRRSVLRGLSGGLAVALLAGTMREAKAGSNNIVSTYAADVALDWYDLVLHLTRTTPGFSPPVASRAFAYVGIALYEALRVGMPGYRSLAGNLPELQQVPGPNSSKQHWGVVANHCLARIVTLLYPTTSAENKTQIVALRESYDALYRPGISSSTYNRSVQRGNAVAQHIFDWSRSDGGHEGYLDNFPPYTPPTGPGKWEPTLPGFLPALQPYWGNNRPFTLLRKKHGHCGGSNSNWHYAAIDQSIFDPGPPPPFSTNPDSTFYRQAYEVFEAVNESTPAQQEIARFWADDPVSTATPPGHSISIASQIIQQEDVDLEMAVETFLKVGIAVADAFISCWNTKYRYNLLRPITYIRQHISPTWLPLLITPPFPEYTSGHSVQSAAMAEVMTSLYGDLSFVDHTHDELGVAPRAFASFEEAAQEAAISRLYGGIHFREAIEDGLKQGRRLGERVADLPI